MPDKCAGRVAPLANSCVLPLVWTAAAPSSSCESSMETSASFVAVVEAVGLISSRRGRSRSSLSSDVIDSVSADDEASEGEVSESVCNSGVGHSRSRRRCGWRRRHHSGSCCTRHFRRQVWTGFFGWGQVDIPCVWVLWSRTVSGLISLGLVGLLVPVMLCQLVMGQRFW